MVVQGLVRIMLSFCILALSISLDDDLVEQDEMVKAVAAFALWGVAEADCDIAQVFSGDSSFDDGCCHIRADSLARSRSTGPRYSSLG